MIQKSCKRAGDWRKNQQLEGSGSLSFRRLTVLEVAEEKPSSPCAILINSFSSSDNYKSLLLIMQKTSKGGVQETKSNNNKTAFWFRERVNIISLISAEKVAIARNTIMRVHVWNCLTVKGFSSSDWTYKSDHFITLQPYFSENLQFHKKSENRMKNAEKCMTYSAENSAL